jgi:hypothetical protein
MILDFRVDTGKRYSVLSNDSEIENNIHSPTISFVNKSQWLQLLESGLVREVHHLVSAEKGAETILLSPVVGIKKGYNIIPKQRSKQGGKKITPDI